MPQMMPMNWILLFNIFLFTFLLFNILNYFNFIYSPKFYFLNKKTINLNWKW